jgi:uncharacterized membrane protein YhaH (DUF805 family)
MFSLHGRIDRLGFFIAGLLGAFSTVPAILVFMAAEAGADSISNKSGLWIWVVGLLLMAGPFVFGVATSVRRCHDIGWSGRWVLLFFTLPLLTFVPGVDLPDVSLALGAVLAFAPSQIGRNRFGEQMPGELFPKIADATSTPA